MRTKPRREWTNRELALLGKYADGEVAERVGVSRKHVLETRKRQGIAAEPTLADQLRAAITASGKTAYALANETGLSHRVIGKFLAGDDMRLASASKLAEALSLRLTGKLLTARAKKN